MTWHRVLDLGVIEEGRVMTVQAGHRSVCLTRWKGKCGALDNHCPHQGGPLGEGSIERGWLRCPWHGYDYDPLTGQPPPGFHDAPPAYPVEERSDGIWIDVPDLGPHVRTVSDVLVETMVAWGVTSVFGMVGNSSGSLATSTVAGGAFGKISSAT